MQIHLEERPGTAWAEARAKEPTPPVVELGVARATGSPKVDGGRIDPVVRERTPECLEPVDGDALGVIVGLGETGIGAVLDHRTHAVGVCGSQHRRRRSAFGDAEDRRLGDIQGIEHSQGVVHHVLQRVRTSVPVRKPHPALIEQSA